MRNLSIKCAHGDARVHVGRWCSALTTALVLALAPVTAIAAPEPAADAAQPEAEPVEVEPPEPEAAPPAEVQPDAIPIIEITPPPEREPVAPEPEPEPEPEVIPPPPEVVPPAPEVVSPESIAKSKKLRKAGIGLVATGGVVAAGGLGVTLAFTIIGDGRQDAEEPVIEDIEQSDSMAKVGGILLASGIVLVAVGGIVLGQSKKKAEPKSSARVRVTPAVGGLVVRF
jgi:hypothetical protein